jgi:CPA1 family monovalent cation:H+ antiporter
VTPGIDQEIPHVLELLVGLLGVAVVVAILVRPLRLPYTVALVIAGLGAGLLARIAGYPAVDVSPELVLLVLLPGLVFEAAYRLRLTEIRRWFGGLLLLAIPGVVISAAVVAIVLNVATGLRLDLAFIVGAMVSATDPAAVIATFKRLTVPRALSTLVDGESLLNDGTGLVLFAIALSGVSSPVSPLEAATSFVATVSVSVVIGLVTGYVAARIVAYVADDHLIELTITVVLAYGSYVLADQIGLSGVIATVTAGIMFGNVGMGRVHDDDVADAIDTVWEFIAYLLTAFVFLLVGLAIPPAGLLEAVVPIAWGIVAILLGRLFVVYVILGGSSRLVVRPGLAERISGSWLHVLFWSGLRGAVALAMALSLPLDIPQRDLLQEITFGIILFTLLIQGTTIRWVVDHTVRADTAEVGADEVGADPRRAAP